MSTNPAEVPIRPVRRADLGQHLAIAVIGQQDRRRKPPPGAFTAREASASARRCRRGSMVVSIRAAGIFAHQPRRQQGCQRRECAPRRQHRLSHGGLRIRGPKSARRQRRGPAPGRAQPWRPWGNGRGDAVRAIAVGRPAARLAGQAARPLPNHCRLAARDASTLAVGARRR